MADGPLCFACFLCMHFNCSISATITYSEEGKARMVTKELIAATVDTQIAQNFRELAKEADRPFSRYINDAMALWWTLNHQQDKLPA